LRPYHNSLGPAAGPAYSEILAPPLYVGVAVTKTRDVARDGDSDSGKTVAIHVK